MATMLWVRLMHKTKIAADTAVPCGPEGFQDALDEAVKKLDMPRPMVLPKHLRDWEEFRQTRFLPEHFLEEISFDRMEIEFIDPDRKKKVNPDYL